MSQLTCPATEESGRMMVEPKGASSVTDRTVHLVCVLGTVPVGDSEIKMVKE